METFKYNHELLKATRKSKNISMLCMANNLCLAERQIKSIEDNSLGSFPSLSIKFVAIKKYITALGLEYQDVIENFDEVAECFTPQKEFMFTSKNLKKESSSMQDQSLFDEIKEEFMALPKEKKLQYIRNTALGILLIFVLYECFFNEAITTVISEYYSIVVDFIVDIPNKFAKIPSLLMKYGK
jgi:cytoskeletal protein RodZ